MILTAALVQTSAGMGPVENLQKVEGFIRQAAAGGAEFVLTPETTNIIAASRANQRAVLHDETADPTLARLRELAGELGISLLIGSLALKTGDADGRFANRSFLIAPNEDIRARYDKIHMFDVDLGAGESYRESAAFRPGNRAVVVDAGFAKLGLSICYDMRFPALYRSLAIAGAQILTVPAAFTVPTGRAHWHALLRARAIETGCFVLAPAQCGTHADGGTPARHTYGHSLAVSPWGEVLADGGESEGVTFVSLDLNDVGKARAKIPSLKHSRVFTPPGDI